MGKPHSNRRHYLTADQLDELIKAARKGRYGRRNATLVLVMARHGLRVTEAIDLRWSQIDFSKGHLHVMRLKNGIDSVHPIQGDELRALRELKRSQEPQSAFVFTSERAGPMTRSNVAKMSRLRLIGQDSRTAILTSCGTLPATSWLMPATTLGGCNFGWATPISSTPPLTRN